MATQITPTLNSSGNFTLLAPWNNDLIPNTNYTCISIRELQEIVNSGGDPFNDYYVPKSLDQSTYNTDVANGVSIVGLQAADSSVVYVPTSYIASWPDGGGVPYRVMLLSINLGAIPDSLDLTPITTKIAADVMDNMGITATVRAVAVSNVQLISQDDAAATEAARTANITNSSTDYSKYLTAQANYQSAMQQIQELEQYILSLNGGQPPGTPAPSTPTPSTPSPTPTPTPTPTPSSPTPGP
jgi:hypothetical protein